MPVLVLAITICLESVQWLIVLSIISNYIPVDSRYIMALAFERNKASFHLTRQILLYRIFVMTNIVCAALFLRFWRQKLEDKNFYLGLKQYALVQLILILIQSFGVFKIVTLDARWAWGVLYAGVVAAMLSRIFWPELRRGMSQLSLVLLGHILSALLAIFLGVKWLCFYVQVPLLYWFVPVIFFLLLMHIKTLQWMFFAVACVLSGVVAAYHLDIGLALMMAVTVYAAAIYWEAPWLGIKTGQFWSVPLKGWITVAWVMTLAGIILGKSGGLFKSENLPIYAPLSGRHFFSFIVGLIVPLVYLLTAAIIGALLVLRQVTVRYWVMFVICIYGLLAYSAYVWQPQVQVYYSISLPLIIVICFWVHKLYQYVLKMKH